MHSQHKAQMLVKWVVILPFPPESLAFGIAEIMCPLSQLGSISFRLLLPTSWEEYTETGLLH